jgi:predicted metallopeptidase
MILTLSPSVNFNYVFFTVVVYSESIEYRFVSELKAVASIVGIDGFLQNCVAYQLHCAILLQLRRIRIFKRCELVDVVQKELILYISS